MTLYPQLDFDTFHLEQVWWLTQGDGTAQMFHGTLGYPLFLKTLPMGVCLCVLIQKVWQLEQKNKHNQQTQARSSRFWASIFHPRWEECGCTSYWKLSLFWITIHPVIQEQNYLSQFSDQNLPLVTCILITGLHDKVELAPNQTYGHIWVLTTNSAISQTCV